MKIERNEIIKLVMQTLCRDKFSLLKANCYEPAHSYRHYEIYSLSLSLLSHRNCAAFGSRILMLARMPCRSHFYGCTSFIPILNYKAQDLCTRRSTPKTLRMYRLAFRYTADVSSVVFHATEPSKTKWKEKCSSSSSLLLLHLFNSFGVCHSHF